MPESDPERPAGRVARVRAQAHQAQTAAEGWLEAHRGSFPPLDVAMRVLDRDREIGGSVISSALAYRMFLFAVPFLLLVVALIGFGADELAREASDQLGLAATLAGSIDSALSASSRGHWIAAGLGLYGVLWTGRSLSKVFIAASARSWQVPVRGLATPIRTISIVLLLICSVIVSSTVYRWITDSAGVVGDFVGLLAVFAVFSTVWFVTFLVLPHQGDPSGSLPGASVMAVATTAMLWFSRFYLPSRLERASDVYGGLAAVTVGLAWLFVFSRLFVLASSLNAVLWERYGSLGGFVFGLPGVRAIPRRYPKVREFFGVDLDEH